MQKNCTISTLSIDDKKNYEKAISFFSHASGGVIIWGIDSNKNNNGVHIAKKFTLSLMEKNFLVI